MNKTNKTLSYRKVIKSKFMLLVVSKRKEFFEKSGLKELMQLQE